jgi:putative ABC transport system permease protein
MSALLFEVSPADATAFAAAAVALLLVSVLASVLPARRAARVDPLAALKYE